MNNSTAGRLCFVRLYYWKLVMKKSAQAAVDVSRRRHPARPAAGPFRFRRFVGSHSCTETRSLGILDTETDFSNTSRAPSRVVCGVV